MPSAPTLITALPSTCSGISAAAGRTASIAPLAIFLHLAKVFIHAIHLFHWILSVLDFLISIVRNAIKVKMQEIRQFITGGFLAYEHVIPIVQINWE